MVYNKVYAQIGEERHIVIDPINYQYDVKQILVLTGETVPDYYEADVCNVGDTATLTMVGTEADGVEIPDKFLLDGRNVLVYVVIPGSGGDVQTRYDITIPVDERAEREDIDPSEAEQQQIDSLINALNSGVERAEAAATEAENSASEAAQTVAGGVGAINTARDGALTAIGRAGTTQTGAVNQAGADQVAAVNQAGATQAQAVEDKGDEVLDSIPQDYSDLVDDVADLTRQLSDLGNVTAFKAAILQLAQKVAYIDEHGQDYYDDLYDAFYPPVPLASISTVFTQGYTVVYDTDSLDVLKPMLIVTAVYSDGTSGTVSTSDYTLSGTLSVGTSTITVSYGGKTDTFSVTVTHQAGTYSVTNNLTNCTNSNGASTVIELENYSGTITANAGYTMTGATISVTMNGTDITSTAYRNGTISIASASGNIVINASAVAVTLSSISAVFTQGQTVVYDTDSLDVLKPMLIVTAVYSDGTSGTVSTSDYTLSGTLSVGTSTITVSYGGKTDTFSVTVTHQAGTYSVTNNLTNCTNSNGASTVIELENYSGTITANAGYTMTGATISVTMNGTDITSTAYRNGTISIASASGNIVINASAVAVTLSSISAVFTQGQTVVYDTDSLDVLESMLVVTATYSDSSTATISSDDYILSGTLSVGTSSITVSYGGKTATFNVTVTASYFFEPTFIIGTPGATNTDIKYNADSRRACNNPLAVKLPAGLYEIDNTKSGSDYYYSITAYRYDDAEYDVDWSLTEGTSKTIIQQSSVPYTIKWGLYVDGSSGWKNTNKNQIRVTDQDTVVVFNIKKYSEGTEDITQNDLAALNNGGIVLRRISA